MPATRGGKRMQNDPEPQVHQQQYIAPGQEAGGLMMQEGALMGQEGAMMMQQVPQMEGQAQSEEGSDAEDPGRGGKRKKEASNMFDSGLKIEQGSK